MQLPGRKYQAGSGSYRYGFNGKEKSDEVYGDGNVYDYGFRIYNPRLGRFLSVDPLTNKYAELTPYQFSSNNPIFFIDIDGQEGDYYFKKDGGHLIFINYVDHGKGKPNRIFVMDGFTASGKKENRLEKNGAYWEQRMTPTSMYSEGNFRSKSGEDSQFDIDRRSWLWGSGSDYSDKNLLQRYKADGNDNPDKEVAVQLIAMMFMPTRIKTEVPTAETPVNSTNTQAKSSTASKNTGSVESNTGLQSGSGTTTGVIELNANVKSNKALQNSVSRNSKDFVFDPTTEKFAMAGNNAKELKHFGLTRIIGASETNVVGGTIKLGSNGEIMTSQWSGTYGGNWTPQIAKKFEAFMEKVGVNINHSNKATFKDGSH